MGKAIVIFKGLKGRGFWCSVTTQREQTLTVQGALDDIVPTVDGPEALTSNPALVSNLWAYAMQEKLARVTRSAEKRKAHRKAAKRFLVMARVLAHDVESQTDRTRDGWCSECLTYSTHVQVGAVPIGTFVYLCRSCGGRTARCVAPTCASFASRGSGAVALPEYCAEHRHDIPSFERASASIADL